MDKTLRDKEEKIYNELIKLKKGTKEEKMLALKCIGILGNELTTEPLPP